MASPISALISSSSSNGAANSSTTGTSAATDSNQGVFLQLLVSQLKNQDPLNPTDSTQFVSELAQFSQLEQVIAIRSDIESKMTSTPPATQTPTTAPVTATKHTQS
jgi:flagellar basal-body rod modification protein FlgD